MKKSEIRKEGARIIDDIYCMVWDSDEKELWRKAIESIQMRIYKLEITRDAYLFTDHEKSRQAIRNLWFWRSAFNQMIDEFGHRFLGLKIEAVFDKTTGLRGIEFQDPENNTNLGDITGK